MAVALLLMFLRYVDDGRLAHLFKRETDERNPNSSSDSDPRPPAVLYLFLHALDAVRSEIQHATAHYYTFS